LEEIFTSLMTQLPINAGTKVEVAS
jgi:hypothetical protein